MYKISGINVARNFVLIFWLERKISIAPTKNVGIPKTKR